MDLNISDSTIIEKLKGCGVNLKSVHERWFENHLELLMLKFHALTTNFEIPEMHDLEAYLHYQLLYRYELEVNQAKRSCFRLLCEGDGILTGLYTVYIKNIRRIGKAHEVLLCDGWYSLWTTVDTCISRLIESEKLRIGQKIQVCNPDRQGPEAVSIFDAENSSLRLKISYNSIRPCRWFTKLGHRLTSTFCRPLHLIEPEGGDVPCIEVMIVKTYTEIVVVMFEDGSFEEKSKREWGCMQATNQFDSAPAKIVSSVTKNVKLVVADAFSDRLQIPVKLFSVTEDLVSACQQGRKLRILKPRPMKNTSRVGFELKVYQSGKQIQVLELTDGLGYVFPGFHQFHTGGDYDVKLKIVRFDRNEKFFWGLTDQRKLCSVGTASYKDTLPRFQIGEEVSFKDLRYVQHDEKFGIEVFEFSIVTDWERKRQTLIDAYELSLRNAIEFVGNLVNGQTLEKSPD